MRYLPCFLSLLILSACSSEESTDGASAGAAGSTTGGSAGAAGAAGAASGGAAGVNAGGQAGEPNSGEPGVRFVGRTVGELPERVRFAWSGAGLVFRFNGTGARVRMVDGAQFFSLLVDGAEQPRLETSAGEQTYTVATGLAAGEHTVELYRRTEPSVGVTSVLGVEIDGELLAPPAAPARRIEIIGDSITCGYGNEGPDRYCSFSPDTENHYLTYGAVAARAVGAELSTVAWSGKGVVCNYGDGASACVNPLPVYYDRVIPGEATSVWDYRVQPHAVVINLGTNDFSTNEDPDDTFADAYVAFLAHIRSKNPDATILCGLGPLLGGADQTKAIGYIQSAVQERATAGDTKVKYVDLTLSSVTYGCDWHPSIASHEAMAQKLEAGLRAEMGW
jgi:lysophospholipase L1-like esterase